MASKKKVVAKKKPVAVVAKPKTHKRSSPEDRAVDVAVVTPEPVGVIAPEPAPTVKCRYCEKEIPRPEGTTFFKCDECAGTGEPKYDQFNNRV